MREDEGYAQYQQEQAWGEEQARLAGEDAEAIAEAERLNEEAEMRDKDKVEQEVGRIPIRQETVEKCLAEFDNHDRHMSTARWCFDYGHPTPCKLALQEAMQSIEIISVLVGGTND